MVGRFVLALGFLAGALVACTSGSGPSGNGTTDDNGGNGNGDHSGCVIRTSLSGGLEAQLGGSNQACVYTSGTVVFAPLDAQAELTLTIRNIEAGQTGTFAATVDVRKDHDRWIHATCSVQIDTNALAEAASDGGAMFDSYLLEGSGSCSTPAAFQGDADAKPAVTVAPFTFTTHMLFY